MKRILSILFFTLIVSVSLQAQFVVADFTASSTSICAGQSVTFTDASLYGGGAAPINSWSWNFDYTSAGSPAPSPATANTQGPHTVTFNASGTYVVRLTVSNGTQTESSNKVINVSVGSSLPLAEGFEGTFPAMGWSVSHTGTYNYDWQQNTTTGQSGTKSAWADLFSNNIGTSTLHLTLPRVDLSGYAGGTFDFYLAYRGWSGEYATLTLQASTDCGATYTNIWQKTGEPLATTNPTTGSELNTPLPSEWRLESVDISSLVGNPAVQFRFALQDTYTNNLFIDNINISAFTSTPPNAPTSLNATAPVFNQVNLSWTDNSSNEYGFKIEKATTSGGPYTQIATVAANVTNYTDNAVTANTTYYYQVRSYIGSINSTYSNEASVTTPNVALNSPTGLTATAVSSSRINLFWVDADVNEDTYKIERSTDGTNYTEIVGNLPANTTSYSDVGLTAGTLYYYRVRCSLGAANSLYSSVAQATTFVVITAPTSLVASASSTSSIDLSWSDNADNEANYTIERSLDGINFTEVGQVAADIFNYTDMGLSSGTLYFYRVRGKNGSVYSDYSNIAQATPTVVVLSPTDLQAVVVSPTQIDLTWTDNATNEAGYIVERSLDGVIFEEISGAGLAANSTAYVDAGLIAQTTYYYRVRAFNGPLLVSDYSNIAQATTPSPNAIIKDMSSLVNLYPNPNNGAFKVDLTPLNVNDVKIEIYNSVGSKVFEQGLINTKECSFNLKNLSKGIYYLYCITDNEKVGKKIIIQ
ncbi:MAG: fibronectin type III domain-containing protein [Thermonemataceae bacterium]|nr:fibronectin type III domain-containing protein [Thermonemataceae bacterium]